MEKSLAALRQAERADAKNADVFRLSAVIYDAQGRLDQCQDALLKELAAAGLRPQIVTGERLPFQYMVSAAR